MGTTTTDFTVSPFVPSANNYSTNLSSFWRIKLVSSKDVCEIVDGGRCVTDGPGNYGNREYCEVEALRSLIVTAKQYSVEAKYDSITINGIPYMNSIPNEGVSMNKGARWFWNSDSSVTRPGYKLCAEEANTDVSGYQLLSNGRCPPGREVKSLSECSTAAKYLNLYDQSASLDNQPHGVRYDPPFCYYEDHQLKFNGGRNTGSCTTSDRCLCAERLPRTTSTTDTGFPHFTTQRWTTTSYFTQRWTTTPYFTVSPFVPSANNYSTNLSSFWRIKLVSSKDVCEIVDGGRCVTDGPGNYGNREYCEVEA